VTAPPVSFLATRRGRLLLLLLCAVQFLDVVDSSIMNVALPSIRRDLGALLACAIFLLAAAVIALRATNSRGEPAAEPGGIPAAPGQVPAPELAD
jgi:hypothetical protein